MKKSLNKFAVALWVLAALMLLGTAAQYHSTFEFTRRFAAQDGVYAVEGAYWKLLIGGLLSAAQLASFGVIIELIDQIRWDAQQRAK